MVLKFIDVWHANMLNMEHLPSSSEIFEICRVLKAALIQFLYLPLCQTMFLQYILYLHLPEIVPPTFPPLFFVNGHFWIMLSFGHPRSTQARCGSAPEVNFGTKVGKAPTTPGRRQRKGDPMEIGLAPEKNTWNGSTKCELLIFFGPNHLFLLFLTYP